MKLKNLIGRTGWMLACFLSCSALSAVSLAQDGCPTVAAFAQARSEASRQGGMMDHQQALQWLDAMLKVMDDPNCSAARLQAYSLADAVGDFVTAEAVAEGGVVKSRDAAEKASWLFDASQAAFKFRKSRLNGTLIAIQSLDRFLQVAPDLKTATVNSPEGGSVDFTLAAMTQKAQCYRENGDFLSSAAIEQQAAATWTSAPAGRPENGGLLPEESLYRAAMDFAQADQYVASSSAIASIRNLPLVRRPATQHGWNLVAMIPDYRRAVRVSEAVLQAIKPDGWSALQVSDLASRGQPEPLETSVQTSLLAQINVVLSLPIAELESIQDKLSQITSKDSQQYNTDYIAILNKAQRQMTTQSQP